MTGPQAPGPDLGVVNLQKLEFFSRQDFRFRYIEGQKGERILPGDAQPAGRRGPVRAHCTLAVLPIASLRNRGASP